MGSLSESEAPFNGWDVGMTNKEIAEAIKKRFGVDRDPGYISAIRNGSRRSEKIMRMIQAVLIPKGEKGGKK